MNYSIVFLMLNLKTNQTFRVGFDSPFKARKYYNKCKHSKVVKCTGWIGQLY